MAGFAGLFGGLGEAAQNIGAQVRPILEKQRESYAHLLGEQAREEGNPDYRNQLIKLAGDALSGQPLHKIIPAHTKLLENMHNDHMAAEQLHKVLNPEAPAPPKIPGPQAGAAPGTGYAQLLAGGAAQPQSSPVSPAQQTTNQVESAGRQVAGDTGGPLQMPQPQAQAQAPVTVTPPQPQQQTDPRAMRQAILDRYAHELQQATPAMRPYLKNQMDMAVAALGPFELQAMRQHNLEQFRNTPEYKGALPMQQGAWGAEAAGFSPGTAGMASMMRAAIQTYPMAATGADVHRLYPDLAEGIPNDGSPVTIRMNAMTGKPSAINNKPVRGVFIQGYGPDGPVYMDENPYAQTPGTLPSIGGVTPTPPSMNAPRNLGVDSSNHELIGSINALNHGGSVTQAPGVNPMTLPTNRQQVVDLGDRKEIMNLQNTRGAQAPQSNAQGPLTLGPPGNPGAPIPEDWNTQGKPQLPSLEKGLTPQQKLGQEKQLGVFDQTLKRASYVRDHINVLSSMIDAGKILLALNPHTGALIVSRFGSMTPEQEKFAAEFQTLSEDINALRSLPGFAGFRGPEAFEALQAQRGRLMANPNITKQVLGNTIETIVSQRDPIADKLKKPRWADPAAGGGSMPTVTSKDQYDKLPSGTIFMEDGKKYRKP